MIYLWSICFNKCFLWPDLCLWLIALSIFRASYYNFFTALMHCNSIMSIFFYTMKEEEKKGSANDYLANERTFLAWIRTSIGIMAFGFVLVKFSFFIKQITFILQKNELGEIPDTGYSSSAGISLVAVGVVTLMMAFIRYRATNKQLDEGKFANSSLSITLLTALILFISIALIVYLVEAA